MLSHMARNTKLDTVTLTPNQTLFCATATATRHYHARARHYNTVIRHHYDLALLDFEPSFLAQHNQAVQRGQQVVAALPVALIPRLSLFVGILKYKFKFTKITHTCSFFPLAKLFWSGLNFFLAF